MLASVADESVIAGDTAHESSGSTASFPGAVLAASLSGARLAHVTYGPRPEDGLEMLEPGGLAAQLLEVSAH